MCLDLLEICVVAQSVLGKIRAFCYGPYILNGRILSFFFWFFPILLLNVLSLIVLGFVDIIHGLNNHSPTSLSHTYLRMWLSSQLLKHQGLIIYLAHMWLPGQG